MTAQLQKRVEALEARAGDVQQDVLFVSRVVVGEPDAEPTKAQAGDVVLLRNPGESLPDFMARAEQAVREQVAAGRFFYPVVHLMGPHLDRHP